jgi:hemoglobin/transferrin/lactoferrin receptor protein
MFTRAGIPIFRCQLALGVLLMLIPPTLAAQTHRTMHGVVREAATGAPLPGVLVSGDYHSVVTNAGGRFSLMVHEESEVVRFRRLGYVSAQVTVETFTGEIALETQPVLLDRIVAEAERSGEIAAGTALAVTHAGHETFQSRPSTSVAGSLATLEGVSVVGTGAWGSRATLRGLGGERIAVMIDGNRLNRACTFGMDQGLATIDPMTIERVEILTGPGSTLYGSGNLGGVINVVTRRGTGERPLSGEVRSGASSGVPGGTVGGSLWLQKRAWDVSASLDAASFGDYQTAAGEVQGSGFRQASGDLKLGWSPRVDHRFLAQGQRYSARDIGWPGMSGHDMSIPEEDRYSLSLDYGWQRGRGTLDAVSGRAYQQRLDHHMVMRMQSQGHTGAPGGDAQAREGSDPATAAMVTLPALAVTDARSYSTTRGARLQARLLPATVAHVDAGFEATQWIAEATRWTETDAAMGEPHRVVLRTWPGVRIVDLGAFAQAQARIAPPLTLSAGARVDHVRRSAEDVATTTEWIGTGNVGARAWLGAGFSLRTTAGMGYRIPDPTELFGLALRPDGYLYRGNPDLSTETNRNVEVSLGYDARRVNTSVTAFRNDLHDLIGPRVVHGESVGGQPVRTYDNIATARLDGFSGSARWMASGALDLGGTATYVRGVDRATGDPLPQMPPLQGSASARIRPGMGIDWLEIESHAASRQTRVAGAIGEGETPAYAIFGTRAGFDVAGGQVVLGVENLFDRFYRNHLDNPGIHQPGRNFFIRATRAF